MVGYFFCVNVSITMSLLLYCIVFHILFGEFFKCHQFLLTGNKAKACIIDERVHMLDLVNCIFLQTILLILIT